MFPKPGKKKKGRANGWFKKTWKAMSDYVRVRDAADGSGLCRCISCGRFHHWKEMDAGHYIPREFTEIWLNEINVNAQCRYCNFFLKGNQAGYKNGIIEKYGESALLMLEANQKKRPWRDYQLRVKYDDFKKRFKELTKEKGL